uniref:Uncharacterized protein n=1 Tax=Parascaris univalens TaxID=6257 RepID=A0A915BLL5_PARUN
SLNRAQAINSTKWGSEISCKRLCRNAYTSAHPKQTLKHCPLSVARRKICIRDEAKPPSHQRRFARITILILSLVIVDTTDALRLHANVGTSRLYCLADSEEISSRGAPQD